MKINESEKIMRVSKKTYTTKNGSTVTIIGKGGYEISFDWFEEDNACIDCVPEYIEYKELTWSCDYCGGGCAELTEVAESEGGDVDK